MRVDVSVIDEQTERAVLGWVRLADEMAQRPTVDDRASCASCGSRFHVLDDRRGALCARCYLERGEDAG